MALPARRDGPAAVVVEPSGDLAGTPVLRRSHRGPQLGPGPGRISAPGDALRARICATTPVRAVLAAQRAPPPFRRVRDPYPRPALGAATEGLGGRRGDAPRLSLRHARHVRGPGPAPARAGRRHHLPPPARRA